MWLTIDPEEINLHASRLDMLFWSSVLDEKEGVKKKLPRRADKVIAADFFQALYDWEPMLKEEPPNPAVSEFINQMMARSKFQEVRDLTVGDKHKAAAGAVHLYAEMMRQKASDIKTLADQANNMDLIVSMGNQDSPSVKATVEAMQQANQMLADQMKEKGRVQLGSLTSKGAIKLNEQKQAIDGFKIADTAMDAVIEMMQTGEEMAEFDEAGHSGGYTLHTDDQSERALNLLLNEQLIERVTKQDNIKRIMKIAGRMKPIVQSVRSQKPKPAPPPIEVTIGGDLQSMLAQELVVLADEDTEDLFFQRFLNNELLMYDRKERPKEGRGPFIVCVDVSGSMSGSPAIHAAATFVALARLALKERRVCGLMQFGDRAGRIHLVKDSDTLIRAVNANDRVGGGTDFDAPMSAATEFIREGKITKNADVVIVTDGYSRLSYGVSERIKQAKKKMGVRYFGILIGGRWEKDMQAVLDASTDLSARDLPDLEWFRDLAQQVI